MSPVVIERLELDPATLGEGPHWHSEEGVLYMVDIENYTIIKYDRTTRKHIKAKLGKYSQSLHVKNIKSCLLI